MNVESKTDGYSNGTNEEDDELVDVYTVEDAIDKMGCGVFQVFLSLFAGGMWLVEAFEVMILSILSTVLRCEWNLSYFQEATITMVVFLGFLFGSPVWGVVADKFGRKKTLLVVQIWGVVFGVVSAFSPEYYSLLIFRGLLGFGLGGGFLGVAYCVEFLPARTRPVIASFTQFSWAIGSVLEALLALVVMTNIKHEPWRWLLGLSAFPLFVLTLLFPFIPESPRYLILNGKEDKAKRVLAWIARVNCSTTLSGRLITQEEKERLLQERNSEISSNQRIKLPVAALMNRTNEERPVAKEKPNYGTLPNMEELTNNEQDNDVLSVNESERELCLVSSDAMCKQTMSCNEIIKEKLTNYYQWFLILFKNGYWKTTLLLWYLWWSANIIYYGGTLLTTSLFQHDQHCGLSEGNNSTEDNCKSLSKSDYIHLVWTTCGEFPGTIFIILLLLIIGRKKSMALVTAAAAVCYGLLFLCLDKTALMVFLFGVRGFASGLFQAIYLYTPEVYPTSVRAFGMSLCSSFSRIGGMLSPYIAQTLLAYNAIATISIFVGLSVMSSAAALLLPIETRGRAMKVRVDGPCNNTMSCSIQSCFYPNISDKEVEKILKSAEKDGSFLLWRRNRQNGLWHCHYILSVKSNQRIIHLKMQCVDGCYSMCGEEEFDSPYDVIQNCMENTDVLKEKGGNIIELKQPVVNSEKPTRWYHSNIYPKDAERVLNKNGKHGSYLVRGSYRHPGDYVLCVRLKDEVVCVKIFANGEKYDVGVGSKQFNSIGDLIAHYKKHPLRTVEGTDIHLDQGIDSDALTSNITALPPNDLSSLPPNDLPFDITDHDKLQSQNPPTPVACSRVNIQEVYNDTSTEALVQTVEKNGKHTLSLDGNDNTNPDSWFKECSYVYRNEYGFPTDTVYLYECHTFPGHYIRWYYGKDTVDCELTADAAPVQCHEYQWSRKEIGNFTQLVAYRRNPPDSSPAYLTFDNGGQPIVVEAVDHVMKWYISPY